MQLPIISRRQAWIILTIFLAGLLLGIFLLIIQQTAAHLDTERDLLKRETRMLATLVETSLQAGNYQNLDKTLAAWGQRDADLAAVTVTAANGFILSEYRRAKGPADIEMLSEQLVVNYSYRGKATIDVNRSLSAVLNQRRQLALQLAAAYVAVSALLAVLLQALLSRQKETMTLRSRTQELDRSNIALQDEIQRRQQTESSLFEAKERAEVTLHSIGDAVITTDAHGIVDYLNPVATALTGWPLDEAVGLPLTTVFPIVNELTRQPVENPVESVLRDGNVVALANHTVLISRDERKIAIEDSAAPIRNRENRIVGVVLVFHDVTKSRDLANQISWQASHDALTGLVNRREFENRLSLALAVAHQDHQEHALLYLDLDQFKVVNDTCGHVAGDELLRQLSRTMLENLRANDTLARLGGDEFGVLLENCPIEQAMRIAETLREVISDYRFHWGMQRFEIAVSIGVVEINHQSASVDSLFATADMACYAAKESGRNRTHLYRESDAEMIQRYGEMKWVSRLNEALREENQLILYRQVIVPLNGAGSPHYEILVRLRGENGQMILPSSFLPAAERYNLMPQIDRWVVTNTLAQMNYGDETATGLTAINLSGASLGDKRFLDFLRNELSKNPAIANKLCFEVTETAAITNLTQATDFMHELRQLGCCFALDDFGTGLSSFSYLKNLPVDYLKIDGSLVRDIVTDPTDFAIVQSINNIGHTLGMKTVAEYAENESILNLLTDIHVDYAQGLGVALPEAYPSIPDTSLPG